MSPPRMDKGGKAKTLATASTLQKVVCPAPERDPQEILSNGWRKVGEQKRYTNRLVGGQVPDIGLLLNSADNSNTDTDTSLPGPNYKQQTGRQVLDKMFGHLRPHHNHALVASMRMEEHTLENGLSSQAARAAFYRPVFSPSAASPDSNAAEPPLFRSPSPVELADLGPGARGYLTISDASDAEDDGGGAEDAHSPASTGALNSPPAVRQRWGAGNGGPGVGRSSPLPPAKRDSSPPRPGSGGGNGNGGGSSRRLGSLPSLSRSYPQDYGPAPGPGSSSSSSVPAQVESPRLPAAAQPAAAGCGARGRRRASIGGEMELPAIGGGSSGGGAASPAAGMGPGKNAAGRARRTSLVVADGGGSGGPGGAGMLSFLPSYAQPGAAASSAGSPSGGGGGGGTMPHPYRRSGCGAAAQGVHGDSTGGGGGGGGVLTAHRPGPRGSLAADLHSTGATTGPLRGPATVNLPAPRMSYNGVGSAATSASGAYSGGADVVAAEVHLPLPAPTPLGLLVQLADLHTTGSSVATLPGVNPAMPLSGLAALAATGLGDAISQLRHIRMGNGAGGNGSAASVAGVKEPRERKVEPGLAGLTPLLPVPLPPIENWQHGGKAVPEVDPCRGIRLVDAPQYVLPRPTAELDLQVKMAAHQAAMRQLVRAEGAPMSESEMEAVKLLGRLERSGARARNYEGAPEVVV